MRWLIIVPLFFLTAVPAQAAPTIANISDNRSQYQSNQIPAYEKLEITFEVNNLEAANLQWPFDLSPPPGITAGQGITVNAEFSRDNFASEPMIQPAFYYQEFLTERRNNREWDYPTGQFAWKVRFAPPGTGNWQYRLRATDAGGTVLSPVQPFSVSLSDNKGFIRVSQNDPRYFEYEDGTYFPGLGYNFRPNTGDIEANRNHFEILSQNGLQLNRMWLSSWSIFGSAWNPWNAMPQDYDGYLPRTGLEAYQGDFRLKMVYRASNPNQPSCTDNCSYWKATRFLGWMSPQASVKPNTDYRIKIRYQAQNISGPRNGQYPDYGLVLKITNQWLTGPHNAGVGTPTSTYGGNTTGWMEMTTTWNSGSNNYLPYFYLTLENVIDPGPGNPAAIAYIDRVLVEEVLGNNQYGPNILPKPIMQQQTYFDQTASVRFDRLVELAEEYGIYLRPVILEKDEYIQNHIDFAGALRTDDLANLFYGDSRNLTAVRWLQQAYWRYLQARWGYSTAIHSWELLNEGNPNLANHYLLTDELGKYMRRFTPNHHMVSTSNWHSFPAAQWAAQPNIDFADVHYYQPRSALEELYDTVLAHLNRSLTFSTINSNVGKPVIRGETGFVESGSGPSIRDLDADTQGIWLHNFTWAQLNPGGMMESYWYTGGVDGQIFNSVAGYDHRPVFKRYFDFIKNIPLNNGNYYGITPINLHPGLRALGQFDGVNARAHVWVQNLQHTWKNVVDGVSIAPVSGTLILTDLPPNTNLRVERWNTYSGTVENFSHIQTNQSGNLEIPINNLTSDVAYKIGDYSPATFGDLNGDGQIDYIDYQLLIDGFDQNYDMFQFNGVVANYGK